MTSSFSSRQDNETMMTIDDEIYEAMRKQEREYMADDYLSRLPSIDQECRRRMVAWFYKLMDFCSFERETVEIAVNYLDRFLSNQHEVRECLTRQDFQLIAMTCLYTAVKIHEPVAMGLGVVASLSQGQITEQDIKECELILLRGLTWRMNPPTTMSFVRHLVQRDSRFSSDSATSAREEVLKLSKTQLEACPENYAITQHRVLPSVLAAAAVSNSLLSLGCNGSHQLTTAADQVVASHLAKALPHSLRSTASSSPAPSIPAKRESTARYEYGCSDGGELSSPKSVSAADVHCS